MKKSLKLVVLASLLSTTVIGSVALAADVDTTSDAFATFVDEGTIEPNGPLRFDSNNQPTDIQFGKIMISGDTTPYSSIYSDTVTFKADGEADAKLAPLNVTTVDNRGTSAGWTMSTKLSKQFETDTGETLEGAKLVLTSHEALSHKEVEGRTAPSGTKTDVVLSDKVDFQPVMGAKKGEGVGTWTTLFGERIDGPALKETLNPGQSNEYEVYHTNDNVQLIVPGSITKVEKAYKAEITWSLSDTPEQ